MSATAFALYREIHPWCTEADYRTILDTVRGRQAKRVLEFGPGNSTLALIEGGAQQIDTCEASLEWMTVWRNRLEKRFAQVALYHYEILGDRLTVPVELAGKTYDLGFVDGPTRIHERPAVIRYALDRCSAVLVPTEDFETTPFLRTVVQELADARQRPVAFMETGPAAGGYALIGEATC